MSAEKTLVLYQLIKAELDDDLQPESGNSNSFVSMLLMTQAVRELRKIAKATVNIDENGVFTSPWRAD